MTMIHIEIDISGDTFGVSDGDRSCGTEVAAILRSMADDVDHESRRELVDGLLKVYTDGNGNEVCKVDIRGFKPRCTILEWLGETDYPTQLQTLHSLVPDLTMTVAEAYQSNLGRVIQQAVDDGRITVEDLYAEHPIHST